MQRAGHPRDVIAHEAGDEENIQQIAGEEEANIVALLPDHAPVAGEDIELADQEEEVPNQDNEQHQPRIHFGMFRGGEGGERGEGGRRENPFSLLTKIPQLVRYHLFSSVFGGGAAGACKGHREQRRMDKHAEHRDVMNSVPGHLSQSMDVVHLVTPPFLFKTHKYELIQASNHGDTPKARSGHRMVADDKYVYLLGGFNPITSRSNPIFNELWRFSRLTHTWELLCTKGPMPEEIASPCMVLLNSSQLLVFGGSGQVFGQSSSNKMYICDLDRLHWEQVVYTNEPEDPQLPTPAYGQGIAYDKDNHCLYVVGGTTGLSYTMCVHRFDIFTRRWELIASEVPLVPPRYRHEIALYQNKLFVIAGGTNQGSFSNKEIPVFDITTRSWSLIPAKPWINPVNQTEVYPEPRFSHDCGHLDNLVVMVGGQQLHDVANVRNRAFKDTWALDLDTLQWTNYPGMTLPAKTYFNAVTMTPQGELFVHGGVAVLSGARNRTNQFRRAFFRVPSLQLLAMDAVRANLQHSLGHSPTQPINPNIDQLV